MNDSKPSGATAISIQGLSRSFGCVKAVCDVSFDVRPGEMFFIIGPSGCGKTTLLRILAGLETADAGSVTFDGREVLHLQPHLRGAPMVFQNYALWPHLSVHENIAFGLVERHVPKSEIQARVQTVLQKVDLAGLHARMPSQLSGGQQQRVVLARALVLNPSIILLDEPLSNLDARLRAEMREQIARLHAETPITFVYVTHDQVEALSLADRMAVMLDGRMAAIGEPAELYRRPPHAFCAGFLGDANLLNVKVGPVANGFTTISGPFCQWQATGIAPHGSPAVCMVRPESVRVGVPNRPDDNLFLGRIKSLRHAGPTSQLVIDAESMTLRATLLARDANGLQVGDHLMWAVSAQDAVLLPSESAG